MRLEDAFTRGEIENGAIDKCRKFHSLPTNRNKCQEDKEMEQGPEAKPQGAIVSDKSVSRHMSEPLQFPEILLMPGRMRG